ncbi:MAG: hypothetical protein WCK37_04120 [Candidatus Falkowbacteria bacterium]
MEIKDQKNAINEILRLQLAISRNVLEKTGEKICFHFDIWVQTNGKFCLGKNMQTTVATFTDRNNTRQLNFVGETIEEATQSFCNFFAHGEPGLIYENDGIHEFKIFFYYDSSFGWRVGSVTKIN